MHLYGSLNLLWHCPSLGLEGYIGLAKKFSKLHLSFPYDGMVKPNLLAKPVLLELEGVVRHTMAVGNRKFWGRDVPATKMLQGIRPWILGNSGECL